ncbi:tRNA dihydrouridine synthase DusB [Bosea vestrisii]|uniref:tRNA dihydrouridine synthase DusB n=1 Tax=Bosea vestrisii TaxID=151416 RepID=UPI0024DF95C1|nr:tRNA dihydrouridine synthase DusB [Bosea vestrisii]WID96899.1 tRNA dihydrouridine synthase DusB [Bosea vestrisii]
MKTASNAGEHEVPIGGLFPASRAFLAPMSGVTDLAMRRIAARFGAGLVVSEMVASDELVRGSEEARLRAEGAGVTPHVVQLAGCEARWLAEAAQVAEASGADIVDINMGCPAKRVVGGWAGSALMRDLDHAIGLVEAVVAAVKVPVTVKMRLGWDDTSRNAPELARRAAMAGAAAITVHGRTRQQFYKGQANWAAIRPVRAEGQFPLIANGDIATSAQAQLCLEESGADYVMVGRAALGRPWLPGAIGATLAGREPANIPLTVKHDLAREHYESLLSLMGRESGVRHARKHLAAYADEALACGLEPDETARRELLTTSEPVRAIAALGRLFSTDPLGAAA